MKFIYWSRLGTTNLLPRSMRQWRSLAAINETTTVFCRDQAINETTTVSCRDQWDNDGLLSRSMRQWWSLVAINETMTVSCRDQWDNDGLLPRSMRQWRSFVAINETMTPTIDPKKHHSSTACSPLSNFENCRSIPSRTFTQRPLEPYFVAKMVSKIQQIRWNSSIDRNWVPRLTRKNKIRKLPALLYRFVKISGQFHHVLLHSDV